MLNVYLSTCKRAFLAFGKTASSNAKEALSTVESASLMIKRDENKDFVCLFS
jgi:hypothetical protein